MRLHELMQVQRRLVGSIEEIYHEVDCQDCQAEGFQSVEAFREWRREERINEFCIERERKGD